MCGYYSRMAANQGGASIQMYTVLVLNDGNYAHVVMRSMAISRHVLEQKLSHSKSSETIEYYCQQVMFAAYIVNIIIY